MTAIGSVPVTRTLSDVIPRPTDRSLAVARDVALVLGFAGLTAIAAQIKFSTGISPVPITGQTFAVLLAGTTLGWRRGLASQLAYWAIGAVVPFAWYAGGDHGWSVATGTNAGYLAGFVLAAAAVGFLAERGHDRHLASSLPAMLAGSAIIYCTGALWLAHSLGISVADSTAGPSAIDLGVAPFLVGDLLKLVAAGLLTPLAWRAVERSTK